MRDILLRVSEDLYAFFISIVHVKLIFFFSVFCLQSSKQRQFDDSTTTVYALALESSGEALETAHERDMTRLRDAVKEKDFDVFATKTEIASPPQVEEMVANSSIDASPEDFVGSDLATRPAIQSKHYVARKKEASSRPTSAKDFFAKTAKKETVDGDKKPSTASRKTKDSSKSNQEKENSDNGRRSKTSSSKMIGNADDFVGDQEEDSDDERDMEEHSKKAAKHAEHEKSPTSKRKNRKTQAEVEEEMRQEEVARKSSGMYQNDSDDEQHFKGAMDAFTTKTKNTEPSTTQTGSGKKRRKKLVEKTTMDSKGYMTTTTEVVWEEVDSDEEENTAKSNASATQSAASKALSSSKAAASKTKTKPSDMKQKGIMGFFAKKK
jgi:hypothetical protein